MLELFPIEMSELFWDSAVAVSGARMKTALIECEADARLHARSFYKIKDNLR